MRARRDEEREDERDERREDETAAKGAHFSGSGANKCRDEDDARVRSASNKARDVGHAWVYLAKNELGWLVVRHQTIPGRELLEHELVEVVVELCLDAGIATGDVLGTALAHVITVLASFELIDQLKHLHIWPHLLRLLRTHGSTAASTAGRLL